MLNLSDNFKNDIISTEQTLTPVVVIADKNDNILYTFSTHNVEINNISVISILKDVSKVKINTDYDKKNLKINTLRANIYNYYDDKDRLTDIFDMVSKKVYLFYKSPHTRTINFTDEINDTDCALVYKGRITRVQHNEQIISILGEDSTQAKINNKSVPYMTQDKLADDVRDRLLEEYKDDKITVPMVFGNVDKSPVLPYLDDNNDRIMNLLFDIHPTAGHFKTSKIPSVSDNILPIDDSNYYLYIKRDKDFIIWNHTEKTFNYQNFTYSRVRVHNYEGNTDQYLLSQLQEDIPEEMGLWDVHGFIERQVDSASTGDGSILDIRDLIIDQSESSGFNIEKLNDNAGYKRTWHRQTDTISNYQTNSMFHFPQKEYNQANNSSGDGRFILLKLDKGVNDRLRCMKHNGEYIGNTFLLSNFEIYWNSDNAANLNPHNSFYTTGLPNEVDYVGFHVAPIVTEIWKERVPLITSRITTESDQDWQDLILHMLISTEEDLMQYGHPFGADGGLGGYAPEPFTYQNAPIRLPAQETTSSTTESKYFSYNNSEQGHDVVEPSKLKKIQGLYYGDTGTNERILLPSANSHDYIAVFEYYPRDWHNFNYKHMQGLKIDNIGFLQSIHAENIREDEIFASIVGRKSHYYTEEILEEPTGNNTPIVPELIDLIKGNNNTYPDFNIISDAYISILHDPLEPYIDGGNFALFNESYSEFLEYLQSSWSGRNDLDDSSIFRNFEIYKNFIYGVNKKIYDIMMNMYYRSNSMEDLLNQNQQEREQAFSGIFSSNIIKAVSKRMLEYLYQTDIDIDTTFSLEYIDPHWYRSYSGEWWAADIYTSEELTLESIDLTDSVNFQYNWDFAENEHANDWINNLSTFIDDTIFSINYALYDALSNTISHRWEVVQNGSQGETYIISHEQNTVNQQVAQSPHQFDWSSNQSVNEVLYTILESLYMTWNNLQISNDFATTTDGIIEKPSDIVMNIMCYELGYGRRIESQDIASQFNIAPDYSQFDMDSIIKSRDAHIDFKMGFAINEQTDSNKLIEGILKESKSYPTFSSEGKFGLMTIKESYTLEDIDREVDIKDIINHKISKTKQEDIMTSCKMIYRFNNGTKNYDMETSVLNIEELLIDYTGYENYGIVKDDGHKDIKLRYHTNTNTVEKFQKYRLLNECNIHNLISLNLPLSYMDLNMGDILYVPLKENQSSYGINFNKVTYLNGQHIYPLFMIMGITISSNSVQVSGYQLHYLGTDGDHKFGIDYDIFGCTEQINTYNYQYYTGGNPDNSSSYDPVYNWNYNPIATVHNNIEIPYYDITADGIINVVDIIWVASHILGLTELTQMQKERLGNHYNDIVPEPDVTHITKMISIILN